MPDLYHDFNLHFLMVSDVEYLMCLLIFLYYLQWDVFLYLLLIFELNFYCFCFVWFGYCLSYDSLSPRLEYNSRIIAHYSLELLTQVILLPQPP